MVISLVGGGGKTATMNYIADYYAKRGKRVIITTTTHIKKPCKYLEISKAEELEGYKWEDTPLVVGRDDGEKLCSIDLKEAEKLKAFADIVLIEADGAGQLPIKVPRHGEPVICECTDVCIVCMGIDAVYGRVEDVCFRKDVAAGLFGRGQGHILTCEDAAGILTDKAGGLKDIGDRSVVFLINKADTPEDIQRAEKVKKVVNLLCRKHGISDYRVAVTSYKCGRGFDELDFLERKMAGENV